MKLKYTSRGMPIISYETLVSIIAKSEIKDEQGITDYGRYLTEARQRIIKEDPALVKFLEAQVSKFPKELYKSALEILIGLYAILETQTEANKLNKTR